jgi:membrane protease YdiL (CAAX protease family)
MTDMRSKVRALVEVAVVVVLLRLATWAWDASSFSRGEFDLLRWSYTQHVLFIVASLAILVAARRSARTYGLDLRVELRPSLTWAAVFATLLGAPNLIAVVLGWQAIDMPRLWLSTLVFQIVFAGFGEEILYRGYYQSRLNAAFGRPFDADGIKFGVGLVVVSLLFGLGHLLNPFNPFLGQHGLDWFAALIALQTGVFYGLAREKTGSILIAALLHASTFWWDFLADTSTRYIAMSLGWAICWILLFTVFNKTKMAGDARPESEAPQ